MSQQAMQYLQHLLSKQDRNILVNYPSFATYQRNGCNIQIQYQHATELSSDTLSWAYSLCEQNMKAMYEDVWGWKPQHKQKELKDLNARYLMAAEQSGTSHTPVAYLHFRYTAQAWLSLSCHYTLSLYRDHIRNA